MHKKKYIDTGREHANKKYLKVAFEIQVSAGSVDSRGLHATDCQHGRRFF